MTFSAPKARENFSFHYLTKQNSDTLKRYMHEISCCIRFAHKYVCEANTGLSFIADIGEIILYLITFWEFEGCVSRLIDHLFTATQFLLTDLHKRY